MRDISTHSAGPDVTCAGRHTRTVKVAVALATAGFGGATGLSALDIPGWMLVIAISTIGLSAGTIVARLVTDLWHRIRVQSTFRRRADLVLECIQWNSRQLQGCDRTAKDRARLIEEMNALDEMLR
jgi:hypothetical protein